MPLAVAFIVAMGYGVVLPVLPFMLARTLGETARAAGRVYAAYGGVYIGVAIMWLWLVYSIKLTITDWVGVLVSLLGMVIIMIGSKYA